MRRIRAGALALLFTLALVVSQVGAANAAGTSVKGVGSVIIGGTTYDFSLSGAQVNKGGYTILDHNNPKTRSVSGKASCFRTIGTNMAVIAGPASYKNQQILGGGPFVLIIAQEPNLIYIATTTTLECPTDITGYDLVPIENGGYIDVTI